MLIPGVSCTGFSKCAVAMLILGATFYIYFSRPPFFVRLTSSALKLLKNVSVFFFSIFKSDRLVIEAGSCFCTTLTSSAGKSRSYKPS